MIRVSGIRLPVNYDTAMLKKETAKRLGIDATFVKALHIVRRSVDARHRDVLFQFTVDAEIEVDERAVLHRNPDKGFTITKNEKYSLPAVVSERKIPKIRPVVVGSGPAGLFAALVLARSGVRPILLERGEPVEKRRRDVGTFLAKGILDTHSNVQFGEGGAGTFSDGKLTTGIKNPRCGFVLEEFVKHGAPQSILWDAKPHVGTDNLCSIVCSMREEILEHGGTVLFGHRVEDVIIRGGRLCGLVIDTPEGLCERGANRVIFAPGHSARDTFEMLYKRGLPMEPKPFAVGVRIEHPRVMIDESLYGSTAGHPALGAADYKLACHVSGGNGAYTFCMCPGGVVIAAASEEGGLVVNGMSNYRRDAENSNSALLVGVTPDDYKTACATPLDGVAYQRKIERAAFELGGGGYKAPVQLVGDFMNKRTTRELGDVRPSYLPGVTPANLWDCLPRKIAQTLTLALPAFGRRLAGFDRADAVLTGVESRSSSPVRIIRGDDAQSRIRGIYPCGEGAGYAGGILSAAVDGIYCAEKMLDEYR